MVEMLDDEQLLEQKQEYKYRPPFRILETDKPKPAIQTDSTDSKDSKEWKELTGDELLNFLNRIESSKDKPNIQQFPANFSEAKTDITKDEKTGQSTDNKPDKAIALIDLRNLSVGILDDKNGEAWGTQVKLNLDGFTYSSLVIHNTNRNTKRNTDTKDTLQTRKEWLNRQYKDEGKPTPEEYTPQPYLQLAKVLRSQGEYDDADQILTMKNKYDIRIDFNNFFTRIFCKVHLGNIYTSMVKFLKRDKSLRNLIYYLADIIYYPANIIAYAIHFVTLCLTSVLGIIFDFGLSPKYIVAIFLITFSVGWFGVHVANDPNKKILILNTTHATTMIAKKESDNSYEPRTPVIGMLHESKGSISSGKEITPRIYTIDILIPLLNLHEEQHCNIEPSHLY